MFNAIDHYHEKFRPLDLLSLEDQAIYQARVQKYRPHFKWSPMLDQLFNLCFVHADRNVPGKVSYFATIDAFRADKLTRTSPEMFLERWMRYARGPLKEMWASEVLGKLLPKVEFIENTDPDGWYYTYDNGPHSCMRGSNDVRKYAHPENNLALAFTRDVEEEDRIQCRAIVNRKNNTYVRIYSREEDCSADVFAAALAKLGFKRDYMNALEGQVIYVDRNQCRGCDCDLLAGPYLDSNHRGVVLRDDEKSGVITEGGDPLRSDNDGDGYACSDCS